MADSKKKVEQGFDREEAMKLLFGESLSYLVEDGFDGSKEELQIFKEIYHATSSSNDKVGNGTHPSQSVGVNSRGSFRHSMRDSSGQANQSTKASSKEECSSSCGGSSPNTDRSQVASDVILRNLLSEPVSSTVHLEAEKEGLEQSHTSNRILSTVPNVAPDALGKETAQEQVSCHIVETLRQGLLSSSNLLDRQGDTDTIADIDNGGASNYKPRVRQAAGEGKSVTSPVSQESLAPNETSTALVCSKQSDGGSVELKRNLKRELPCLLESYAHRLLIDAGWRIEHRTRNDRPRPAYFFVNPDDVRTSKALTVAWKVCGERLSASASDLERDDNGREWWDADSFWRDMSDTLDYIEKDARQQQSSVSLLRRWQLLDPFMAVVWIEKKIGILRAKKGLRALKSTTVLLGESKKMMLGDTDAARTVSNAQELSSYLVSGLSADHNSHQINLQSEMHSSICNSTLQEFNSISQEFPNTVMVGPEITKYKRKRRSAAKSEDGSGKKTRKRSKKISEIEAKGASKIDDDDSCREDVAPTMDGETNEKVDLLCHREQINNDQQVLSNDDVNIPAKEEIQKNLVKSGTARQGGKKKGDIDIPLEDKQLTLLNEEIDPHKSKKSEYKAKRLSSKGSSSMISKKQKVSLEELVDLKAAVIEDDKNNSENISEETLVSTSGVSSDPQSNQKCSKVGKPEVKRKIGKKAYRRSRINDDDLLITAIIKKKDFVSSETLSPKLGDIQSKALTKLKSQKGICRLLPRALNKGWSHSKDGKRYTLGARTVLSWLIEMGGVSLKDIVQYRNLKNDAIIKDGWVTVEGILCKCCTKIFSISDFKTHAGLKQHRPSLNLFLQSGKPYTLCQLQAWSAEYKRRQSTRKDTKVDEMDQNDDTCGLCGDGGDLICCDNCPSTYHQSCLSTEELPEGSWYCPKCICVSCGDFVDGKEASSSLPALECSQCENKYHQACIEGKVTCNGEMGSSAWFCGESCQEVYIGLRSRVGVVNCIDDGFSWTILRRSSHDDQKVCSPQKIAVMAECNAKLAICLTLMEECFLPMVDPRTGIDMIPQVLYNLGSPFARLNYQGFYAVVLEKGDHLISVASIRVHGATVAEMPLIATCSGHRRQGMCRRLLSAVEKMLISFKVKLLVLSAIPSLVETWSSGFGFKPFEDDDKQQLANVNLMLFPGTVLLKKNLLDASVLETVENNEVSKTVTEDQSVDNRTSVQVEQVDIQQRNTLTPFSNCLDENISISDINEMDLNLSTDQIISRPSNTTNDIIVRDLEEDISHNINIHAEGNVADAVNDEIVLSFENDGIVKGEQVGDQKHEDGAVSSDVPAKEIFPSSVIQDEVPTALNYEIHAEGGAVDTINIEREIPSVDNEVPEQTLVDVSQRKRGCRHI